jgi:hypothetical protein
MSRRPSPETWARSCTRTEADVYAENQPHVRDQKIRMTPSVHHSHHVPGRELRFYRYLHSVLVQGSQDLEHGQHLGHSRPHGHVCKVSPDADASTESIRDVVDVVGLEGTVVVEESLWHKRVWVGVPRFIVPHRPGETDD